MRHILQVIKIINKITPSVKCINWYNSKNKQAPVLTRSSKLREIFNNQIVSNFRLIKEALKFQPLGK